MHKSLLPQVMTFHDPVLLTSPHIDPRAAFQFHLRRPTDSLFNSQQRCPLCKQPCGIATDCREANLKRRLLIIPQSSSGLHELK